MALISCSECGKQISDKAQACPNCGYTLLKTPTRLIESKGQNGIIEVWEDKVLIKRQGITAKLQGLKDKEIVFKDIASIEHRPNDMINKDKLVILLIDNKKAQSENTVEFNNHNEVEPILKTLEGKGVKVTRLPKKINKGCIGCLSFIAFIFFIGIIIPKHDEITIKGSTAETKITLYSHDSKETAASKIGEAVYEVAKKNQSFKEILIVVYISASGLEDKYGNTIKEDMLMGNISVKDLDDIRKYKDALTYAYNANNQAHYKLLISQMNHAYLLK